MFGRKARRIEELTDKLWARNDDINHMSEIIRTKTQEARRLERLAYPTFSVPNQGGTAVNLFQKATQAALSHGCATDMQKRKFIHEMTKLTDDGEITATNVRRVITEHFATANAADVGHFLASIGIPESEAKTIVTYTLTVEVDGDTVSSSKLPYASTLIDRLRSKTTPVIGPKGTNFGSFSAARLVKVDLAIDPAKNKTSKTKDVYHAEVTY